MPRWWRQQGRTRYLGTPGRLGCTRAQGPWCCDIIVALLVIVSFWFSNNQKSVLFLTPLRTSIGGQAPADRGLFIRPGCTEGGREHGFIVGGCCARVSRALIEVSLNLTRSPGKRTPTPFFGWCP
eukprot:scaffold121676_cov57-Phaeocystis_antarctica.AAC.3